MMPQVILTRPKGRNGALARTLERHGYPVLDAPALQIEALDAVRPVARCGDVLVFVSRQAVEAYFGGPGTADGSGADTLSPFHPDRSTWPEGAWAAAVGSATAQALEAFVPKNQILAPSSEQAPDSEALLAAWDARGLPPAQAHILRATEGRQWLADQLSQRGWQVQCHALYRRLACLWDLATCQDLSAGPATILLLASGQALAAIESSLVHHQLPWPRRLGVVSLHERIVRRLQCRYAAQADMHLHVTLSSPQEAALFQAIVAASDCFPEGSERRHE
jgi:uroporphyrinogen-III synthase